MISYWDFQCCVNILISWWSGWDFVSTTHLNANIFATTRPPEEGSTAADENASKIMNQKSKIKTNVFTVQWKIFTCNSRWRRSGGAGRPGQSRRGRRPSAWKLPNVSLRVALGKSQPEMWQVVRKRAWELHWQRAFLTREDFNCVSGFFATCKDKSSIQHERSSKPWIPPGGGGGGGASTLGHFTSLLWKLSLQEKEKEVRCGVSKDQSWLGLYYWKWY